SLKTPEELGFPADMEKPSPDDIVEAMYDYGIAFAGYDLDEVIDNIELNVVATLKMTDSQYLEDSMTYFTFIFDTLVFDEDEDEETFIREVEIEAEPLVDLFESQDV